MEGTQSQMLPIGTLLKGGEYRVERYISSGGFGNTYEVVHTRLPKRFAMKEFFMRGINVRQGLDVTVSVGDNHTSFHQMKEKFYKEAQRLAKLEEQHIVEVTDFFEENQTAYYVMKLIDGESLSATMKRTGKPFSEAEVLNILTQVLQALATVHAQGIYHLDLKPGNIMRDKKNCCWLIDFGASKQLSATETQTMSTSTGLCYTPGYAPGEQISGSTKRIGPWTDFYALGATLYSLLTNLTPPSPDDVMNEGKSVFKNLITTSQDMCQLVEWMMMPLPKDRPQSVEEIKRRMMCSEIHSDSDSTQFVAEPDSDSAQFTTKTDTEPTIVESPLKEQHPNHSPRKSVLWAIILIAAILVPLMYWVLHRPTDNHLDTKSAIGKTTSLAKGNNVVLAIDVSTSMFAEDFQYSSDNGKRLTNRIEVVSDQVGEFIQKLTPLDSVGLVAFAGEARLRYPLSPSHDTLQALSSINTVSDSVSIGLLPDGTAIGEGIASALKMQSDSSVIILITDGSNNSGNISPIAAADIAVERGIRIFVICLSSEGPVRYPVYDNGTLKYVQLPIEADETTCQTIAETTHGKYYKVNDYNALVSAFESILKAL